MGTQLVWLAMGKLNILVVVAILSFLAVEGFEDGQLGKQLSEISLLEENGAVSRQIRDTSKQQKNKKKDRRMSRKGKKDRRMSRKGKGKNRRMSRKGKKERK